MNPLDVIACVDFGYRLAWRERGYLVRLAAVPLIVKLICYFLGLGLAWSGNDLRMAMILLPSYFTEGWMLAHLVRLVFYGQRWPFQPSGNRVQDETTLTDRAYGVTAGTAAYVTICFISRGLMAVFNVEGAQKQLQAQMAASPVPAVSTLPPPDGAQAAYVALAACLIAIIVWEFRFLFLYIPLSGGLSGHIVTRSRGSFAMSLRMVAIALVSTIPGWLIVFAAAAVLAPADGKLPASGQAILAALQVVADTIVCIIATASIAYGLRNLIEKEAASR